MLNYAGQFFKTRVVFNTLCLDSEMRSLTPFFEFLTQEIHYLTTVRI